MLPSTYQEFKNLNFLSVLLSWSHHFLSTLSLASHQSFILCWELSGTHCHQSPYLVALLAQHWPERSPETAPEGGGRLPGTVLWLEGMDSITHPNPGLRLTLSLHRNWIWAAGCLPSKTHLLGLNSTLPNYTVHQSPPQLLGIWFCFLVVSITVVFSVPQSERHWFCRTCKYAALSEQGN